MLANDKRVWLALHAREVTSVELLIHRFDAELIILVCAVRKDSDGDFILWRAQYMSSISRFTRQEAIAEAFQVALEAEDLIFQSDAPYWAESAQFWTEHGYENMAELARFMAARARR